MNSQKNSPEDEFRRVTIASQIIVLSLAAGVVFFGAVALWIGAQEKAGEEAIVTYVMAALAVLAVAARLLIPALVASQGRKAMVAGVSQPPGQPPTSPATQRGGLELVYQTKTIVGSALLEGAAFANLIAYMIEGQMLSVVMSVLLLFGILLGFPTAGRIAAWVDDQQRLIEEEQALRRAKTP